MIERIINGALRNRGLVLLALMGVVALGVMEYRKLDVEAFPDISPVMVPVFAEPDGIVRAVIDPVSGGLAVGTCPTKAVELYAAGSEPAAECELHRHGFWRRMRDKIRRKDRPPV